MSQAFYVRKSDNKVYSFCPVPTIAESQEIARQDNNEYGTRLAVINTLTFNGILLPSRPALSGVSTDATCLELLDRKSDQLRQALDEDRGNLLIFDSRGYTVLNVRPTIRSIDFPDSRMVTDRRYTIVFEFETDFAGTNVKSYDDTWSFQYQEDDTVSVTHNVSAVGIPSFPAATGALENARTFVLARANTFDYDMARFQVAPYVPALIDVNNLINLNHFRQEDSNPPAGSYGVSETWIMSSGLFKDDRTIQVNYSTDNIGNLAITNQINGTVLGYGDTTFERYNNAASGFITFVVPQIDFFNLAASQQASRTDNRYAGSVSYSIQTIPSGSDALQDRSITRSLQRNDDGTVTQTVVTSARIRPGSLSGLDDAAAFALASNYPLTFAVPPFSASLSGNLENESVQIDYINDSYALTRSYREQGVLGWREEFQTSLQTNAESALTTLSLNGSIVGLGAEPGTNTEYRFSLASGAFYGTTGIQSRIRDRCLELLPTGTCLSNKPRQTSVTYNKKNGIITYSSTFDNRLMTINPRILNEEINVRFALASQVIAEIPIPGKSDGPILQDQETVTGLQKTLSITYRMIDDTNSGLCGAVNVISQSQILDDAITESNILVNNNINQSARGEKPTGAGVFKVQDEIGWNRTTLVFNRNVTWKYTAT